MTRFLPSSKPSLQSTAQTHSQLGGRASTNAEYTHMKSRPQHYRSKLKTTPIVQVNAAVRYLIQLNITQFKPIREVDAFLLRQMNLPAKTK